MNTLTLTPHEVATLLLLNVAVQDVIDDNVTSDTIDELKSLQTALNGILYKDKSPLNSPIILLGEA